MSGRDDEATTPKAAPLRHLEPNGFDEDVPTELKPHTTGFESGFEEVSTVARHSLSPDELGTGFLAEVPTQIRKKEPPEVETVRKLRVEPAPTERRRVREPSRPGGQLWWLAFLVVLLLVLVLLLGVAVLVAIVEIVT